MSNNNNQWDDNEFEDDNDDEFNADGNGWVDSDENVADPFESDNDPDNNWGDIDIEQDVVSEIDNEFWKGYYEKSDKNAALKSFLKVIELINNGIQDTDDFKFKALTEIVILYFNMNKTTETVTYFKHFLSSSNTAKPNELSCNLRKILNTVKSNERIHEILYDLTMEHFKPTNDTKSASIKHLWLSLGIRRCHEYLDGMILTKCEILINELHSYLRETDNKSDTAELLQVYAVKIQLTMSLIDDLAKNEERNMNEYNELQLLLTELITETQHITRFVDIRDNKSMSIIYECWAKVFATNNDWNQCYKYLKESFLLYQQMAHKNTTKCLKYLLISYMILSSLNAESELPNPFAAEEIKSYENHYDILNIKQLVNAFECNDIALFNTLYVKQRYDSDPFIAKYLGFVQLRLQGKALVHLVKSYDRVKLNWLCDRLGMDTNRIEQLIVKLIMDNELNGRLDQVNMVLILKEKDNKQNAMLTSLQNWMKTVHNLRDVINGRSAQKRTSSFDGRTAFGMDYFNQDDIYDMDSTFVSWDLY